MGTAELIDLSKVRRETYSREDTVYRLDLCSWEEEYAKDVAAGNPLIISEAKFIRKNDQMSIAKNSILDPSFEIPVEIGKKIVEYACECHELIGRFNEGRICPKCNTLVKTNYSINLLKRGWIDLEDYVIIVPGVYRKIEKYIGKKTLDEILYPEDQFRSHLNKNKVKSNNPYIGIGLLEFRRRYKEILEFYKKKSKNPQLYQFLIERKNITFSSKILVMSVAFRPLFVSYRSKSEMFYHEINSSLVTIITNLELLKKGKIVDVKTVLGKMQKSLAEIYEYTLRKFKKKEVDLIKQSVIASRVWYSSRMVIISESDTNDIDCVRISYRGFLGLYKLEIVNCMINGYISKDFVHMTALECLQYLKTQEFSTTIDERIYSIMKALIDPKKRKDDGLWILVIRNPSFVVENLQTFRIADVFRDTKDYLSIPHNSLKGFDGDFDGDVLNVYSLKEKCVVDALKEYRPSKLILNNSGESFNQFNNPIDDELVFLKVFADKSFDPIDTEKVQIRMKPDIQNEISLNHFSEMVGQMEYINGNKPLDSDTMEKMNLSTYQFQFSPFDGLEFERSDNKKDQTQNVRFFDEVLSDFTEVK